MFSDDDADENIFTLKVPGLFALKEHARNSAIVPQLTPREGELVIRGRDAVRFPAVRALRLRGDPAIAPYDANLFDMAQKYAAVMTRNEAFRLLGNL